MKEPAPVDAPGATDCGDRKDRALDAFKGLLILGMVLAHLLQILHIDPAASDGALSRLANLVSFAGFLFAFGWGLASSVPLSRGGSGRRVGRALGLLGAYYLLALSSNALQWPQGEASRSPLEILWLRHLPPYSEFMASFAVLSLILLPFRERVLRLCHDQPVWALVGSISLAVCVTAQTPPAAPHMAILVPIVDVRSFPLISYLPWFITGACYALHGRTRPWWLWPCAALATAPWAALSMASQEGPVRFPPSPAWLLGPSLIVLTYTALCDWLPARSPLAAILRVVGAAPLTHLVVSTLAIFLLFRLHGPMIDSPTALLATFTLILLAGGIAAGGLRWVASLATVRTAARVVALFGRARPAAWEP